MKVLLIGLTVIFTNSFSNANAAGPSFSCRILHRLSNVEKMICLSEALSYVDLQLHNAFDKTLLKLHPDKKMKLKQAQEAWLNDRAQCTNQDCIHTIMMNRLTEMDRLIKK